MKTRLRSIVRVCGHAIIRWGEGIAYAQGYLSREDIEQEERDYRNGR